MLKIRLLGRPEFFWNDERLSNLNTHHFEALIGGVLVQRDHRLPRTTFSTCLWPAHEEPMALRNLRQMLHRFRNVWPESEDWLDFERDELIWRARTDFWLDLAQLEVLLKKAPSVSRLEELLELWRGTLMERHTERWITPRRRALEQAVQNYLQIGLDYGQSHQDDRLCALCLQGLLRLNPDYEDGWRRLGTYQAKQGDLAQVRATWDEWRSRMSQPGRPGPDPAIDRDFRELVHSLVQSSSGVPFTEIPIGRENEWNTLETIWSGAHWGKAGWALLHGDMGVGKSLLADKFRARVSTSGVRTVRITCNEDLCLSPYSACRMLLQALPLHEIPAILLQPLSLLLPPGHPTVVQDRTAESFYSLFHLQSLHFAMQEVLRSLTPLLVIVDDAHWCDEESLAVFSGLLMGSDPLRLMVIFIQNTMAMTPLNATLQRQIASLKRRTPGWEVHLPPLKERQLLMVARLLVGERTPVESLQLVLHQSEGNPLLLQALLCERGELNGAPIRSAAHFRQCLWSYLNALPVAAQRLLTAASMLEGPLKPKALARLHEEEGAFVELLELLVTAGFLREHADQTFTFATQVREAIEEHLSTSRRRYLLRTPQQHALYSTLSAPES